MRKLHSLISLLLVLLMLAPCALADAPLLQAASDWNLADTPLSVTLSISLQAHAPFDETRTAMLDRVLAPLSLNLYAADGESGVSVLMNGNELLTMAQKGDAVQFSCMPNVSYASQEGNALELLLGTSLNSIDRLGAVKRDSGAFRGVRQTKERQDDHQGHGAGALLHGLYLLQVEAGGNAADAFVPLPGRRFA